MAFWYGEVLCYTPPRCFIFLRAWTRRTPAWEGSQKEESRRDCTAHRPYLQRARERKYTGQERHRERDRQPVCAILSASGRASSFVHEKKALSPSTARRQRESETFLARQGGQEPFYSSTFRHLFRHNTQWTRFPTAGKQTAFFELLVSFLCLVIEHKLSGSCSCPGGACGKLLASPKG